LKYSVPMKKHWVNPDCQNSEPTKRTVSISAIDPYLLKIIVIQGVPCQSVRK
jgi:hypothetical protein